MTGGRGPDACIDAVGMEAHGTTHRRLLRQGQDRRPAWRPTARSAAPGDPLLPQGRHRLDPRRLRRLARQGAVRRGLQQGPDPQDGPDARAPLPAARCSSTSRAARSTRRSSSRTGCSLDDAPGRLQDVPGQAGRLHQGRAEAVARNRELVNRRTVNETSRSESHDCDREVFIPRFSGRRFFRFPIHRFSGSPVPRS